MSAGSSTSLIIKTTTSGPATPTLLQQIAESVIGQVGKIFMGQLKSIIAMASPVGSPTKIRLEFNSEETTKSFRENYFTARFNGETPPPFEIVQPPIKWKSILLTQVPSTWGMDDIHVAVFNKQTFDFLLHREEKEVSNTKYYTGRVWVNLRMDEYKILRKIPTKIKVPGTKDWYINVHLTKKSAKRKLRTCPLCKQTGTDVHPIQQCKKGTMLSPFKQQEPKEGRRRTQSVSDKTNPSPDTLDKDNLKKQLRVPTSNTSKHYRNYLRRHLDHAEHRYDAGTINRFEAIKIIDDFKLHLLDSRQGYPPDKRNFNGFCDYLSMTYPEMNT